MAVLRQYVGEPSLQVKDYYEIFNSFELTVARRAGPLCPALVSTPDG